MNDLHDPLPRVSCLMVTGDRAWLCRRSVGCFLRQTYPNKELIVIDDGVEDLGPVLADVPSADLVYVKLDKRSDNLLGHLRNLSLDRARGEYVAQWDDDDWYHPERIERQAAVLRQGHQACSLSATLMHLDTDRFVDHPYLGMLKGGVPGTIMHVASRALRYPKVRRAEDTAYLHAWRQSDYVSLPRSDSHLFIRCFHGTNTWEARHFLRRIRNRPSDLAAYLWWRYGRRNLFGHPRFRLSERERDAYTQFRAESVALGLL